MISERLIDEWSKAAVSRAFEEDSDRLKVVAVRAAIVLAFKRVNDPLSSLDDEGFCSDAQRQKILARLDEYRTRPVSYLKTTLPQLQKIMFPDMSA